LDKNGASVLKPAVNRLYFGCGVWRNVSGGGRINTGPEIVRQASEIVRCRPEIARCRPEKACFRTEIARFIPLSHRPLPVEVYYLSQE